MEDEKLSALQSAGLSLNEAKVYSALLKLGSASVVDITKKSGVHRVNVYDVIERLQKKGLIASVMQKNKRFYEASNPEELLKLIEMRQEQIINILPSLKMEYKMQKKKQEVHVFKGPDGVITAYYMMLDQNAPLFAIGGSGLNRKYLKHRHTKWDKERIKRGMKGKLLYFESYRSADIGGKGFEVRFLPDRFKSPIMVDICGDLVVNLLATDDILAIVIENKDVADAYRNYFKFMWEFAKK
jgi:sugar-specific transcriptional regulator TrmB